MTKATQDLDSLLDDVLDDFEQQPPQKYQKEPAQVQEPELPELDAELEAGMEQLLASFEKNPERLMETMDKLMGGENKGNSSSQLPPDANQVDELAAKLTDEFMRMLTGSADADSVGKNDTETTKRKEGALPAQESAGKRDQAPKSFPAALEETMERLRESSDKVKTDIDTGMSGGSGDMALIEEMMKQMGGEAGGENFQEILDSMMKQLMSKDVLQEPIQDLVKKYPEWLEKNKQQLEDSEYQRYHLQHEYCVQILTTYENSSLSESEQSQQVMQLMQKMQDCGTPPKEILDDLAPGLDFSSTGDMPLPTTANCPVQ